MSARGSYSSSHGGEHSAELRERTGPGRAPLRRQRRSNRRSYKEDKMDADELTGSSNEQNLAKIFHNALREADTCGWHALKAETVGNKQLATFFREVQKTYPSVAVRSGV